MSPCTGTNPPAATGPSSLNGFSGIGLTGSCNANSSGLGVVAKYPQLNCPNSDSGEAIAIAEQAFSKLLSSLGSPFDSLEDVGYWRYLDNGSGNQSLIWTATDIQAIGDLQRVPFIQAHQDAQGNMTYYVGLMAVGPLRSTQQSVIFVQDGATNNGAIWTDGNTSWQKDLYLKSPSGEIIAGKYVVQTENGYVYSDSQQGYTNYQDALTIYNQLSGQMTDDMKYRPIADGTPALL